MSEEKTKLPERYDLVDYEIKGDEPYAIKRIRQERLTKVINGEYDPHNT